jgi:hypothetical protein
VAARAGRKRQASDAGVKTGISMQPLVPAFLLLAMTMSVDDHQEKNHNSSANQYDQNWPKLPEHRHKSVKI